MTRKRPAFTLPGITMDDAPVPVPPPETPPPLPATIPPRPRRERLPGTYAGNYLDTDPNPTAGAFVTGGLFTLAFALEVFFLFAQIFSGFGTGADVSTLVRVGLFSLALIVLWVGGAPARWVLAGGAFLFSGRLLVQTMLFRHEAFAHSMYAVVSVLLAAVYLAIFVYTGFSSNVVAFAKGQRAPGKGFSVVWIVVLCGLTLGSLAAMRPLILSWHSAEEKRALAFAEESVRAISAHWEPAAFDERADPQYVADWPAEAKKSVMESMSKYGAVRTFGPPYHNVLGSLDLDHGFRWQGVYTGEEIFEHGNATMNLELERGLFSPWRITAWTLRPERSAPPPTP